MEQARKWLETGGSFTEGVKILGQLGGNVKPFSQLSQFRFIDPKHKADLRKAVEAALGPVVSSQSISPYQEPDIVQQYRAKGRKLLKVQADLHTRLKVAQTDTERYEIAEQLLQDLIPEIDRTYDAIRAYENEGITPPSLEVDAVRAAAKKLNQRKMLYDRIRRLQRYIRTGKREKDIPLTPEDVEAYEKEIIEKTAEVEALCLELGLKNTLDEQEVC